MEQMIVWWESTSLTYRIIGGTTLLMGLIQVIYDLYLTISVALYKHQTTPTTTVGVSVVICAKNEERRLRELIPVLMEQDHPNFELIIVDDSSWDDSLTTLKTYQLTYPNLHVIHLNEDIQRMTGKKFALTMGIKGAKHDVLLLTDADCEPASSSWIRLMTAPFADEKVGVVLGVSPYHTSPNMLSRLISYEALYVAISYLSMALRGFPYMGVGRNLAYRKSLFMHNSGFRSHLSLMSGDDDLFIKEVATKSNTVVVLSPEAQTFSAPKKTFGEWVRQKKRHLTTAPFYRVGTKIALGLWPLSFLLMWLFAILWMVMHSAFLIAGIIVLTRYIVHFFTFRGSLKKIGQEHMAFWGLLLENVMWMITPVIWISNQLSKPRTWN